MTVETSEPSPTWIPSVDDLGSRLALVRHRMGWNIKEAARECGIPAATWRLWEVDGALPRNIVTIAMAIATKTGCDYLWLVHGPDRGAALPRRHYVGARVVARVGHPPGTPPTTGQDTHGIPAYNARRPVQQTRPLGGGSLHHLPPAAR